MGNEDFIQDIISSTHKDESNYVSRFEDMNGNDQEEDEYHVSSDENP